MGEVCGAGDGDGARERDGECACRCCSTIDECPTVMRNEGDSTAKRREVGRPGRTVSGCSTRGRLRPRTQDRTRGGRRGKHRRRRASRCCSRCRSAVTSISQACSFGGRTVRREHACVQRGSGEVPPDLFRSGTLYASSPRCPARELRVRKGAQSARKQLGYLCASRRSSLLSDGALRHSTATRNVCQ